VKRELLRKSHQPAKIGRTTGRGHPRRGRLQAEGPGGRGGGRGGTHQRTAGAVATHQCSRCDGGVGGSGRAGELLVQAASCAQTHGLYTHAPPCL